MPAVATSLVVLGTCVLRRNRVRGGTLVRVGVVYNIICT